MFKAWEALFQMTVDLFRSSLCSQTNKSRSSAIRKQPWHKSPLRTPRPVFTSYRMCETSSLTTFDPAAAPSYCILCVLRVITASGLLRLPFLIVYFQAKSPESESVTRGARPLTRKNDTDTRFKTAQTRVPGAQRSWDDGLWRHAA